MKKVNMGSEEVANMDKEIASWMGKIRKMLYISLVTAVIGLIIAAFTGPGYVRVSYGIIYLLAILATIIGLQSHTKIMTNNKEFQRELLYPAQHAAFMNFAFALSILLLVQSPLYRYTVYFGLINTVFAVILGGLGLFVLYKNRKEYNVPVAP